eukprot:613563-Pleurochrysis_carterae.AAC.1
MVMDRLDGPVSVDMDIRIFHSFLVDSMQETIDNALKECISGSCGAGPLSRRETNHVNEEDRFLDIHVDDLNSIIYVVETKDNNESIAFISDFVKRITNGLIAKKSLDVHLVNLLFTVYGHNGQFADLLGFESIVAWHVMNLVTREYLDKHAYIDEAIRVQFIKTLSYDAPLQEGEGSIYDEFDSSLYEQFDFNSTDYDSNYESFDEEMNEHTAL